MNPLIDLRSARAADCAPQLLEPVLDHVQLSDRRELLAAHDYESPSGADGRQIGFMVPGPTGQEIHVVSRDGGATGHLTEIVYTGSNHPFDVCPDGSRIVTTNAVHVSDEIWLLEPRVRK